MRQAFGQYQYPTSPEAVYPQEVIRSYRRFVDQRRARRPSEEYREPTDTEMGRVPRPLQPAHWVQAAFTATAAAGAAVGRGAGRSLTFAAVTGVRRDSA
jgi:hypothetical protein